MGLGLTEGARVGVGVAEIEGEGEGDEVNLDIQEVVALKV